MSAGALPRGRARAARAWQRLRQPWGLRASLAQAARYAWHFRITLAGKTVLLGSVLCGLVSLAALDTPVYLLFCAWTAPLAADFVFGYLPRPRLRLVGALPDKAVAGQRLEADFLLENAGRAPAYEAAGGWFGMPREVAAAQQDAAVPQLAPQDRAIVRLTLAPARRGVYVLPPLRAYTLFPFALFRKPGARRSAHRLTVLPAFHPLDEIAIAAAPRYQPGGMRYGSAVGETPEYAGNREYRAGDAPRRLDFRACARLGVPVVREYQEEYFTRVALVLDTHVPRPRAAARGTFEAAVSLCAAAADAIARGEYVVDLFAAGPELYVFHAGRSMAHMDQVLEILAGVEPVREDPFERLSPRLAEALRRTAAVVCIVQRWDAARAALVEAAVEAGCRVKVVAVGHEPPHAAMMPPCAADDFAWIAPETIAAGECRGL